ncbi:hypothetical protein Nepgr_025732 [Nepenthes gracilis]|uniref:Uncharacterized protein n=1 Tax=Nepenthes gracilis TaxID=150966 RepID=A0AAD3T6Y7_NEPGR|nr:hypothetical protein Nepgr_025732 [Nepenthes gracilis]
MINLELEVVSKEQIKPSSSTPNDLRCFKICLLDQLMPVFYIPIILFYPIRDGIQMLPKLKDALSKTLTKFYPLAGRIKNNVVIDCNDEGISFIEARVNCVVLDFLKDPTFELQSHLIPSMTLHTDQVTEMVQVQVTIFHCGGIAIGACFCHRIMDAASISCFLNNWAAITSSRYDQVICPDLTIASSLFPPNDHISHISLDKLMPAYASPCISKTFVFDGSAISNLKAKTMSKGIPSPTRIEVVSAFIWKQAMASLNKSSSILGQGIRRPSMLGFPVNIRTRMTPPIPRGCIGNLIVHMVACCKLAEEEEELHKLVGIVHETISQVDGDIAKRINSLEAFHVVDEFLREFSSGKRNTYFFSSWCKIGMTEVDFGWGKPLWIGLLGWRPISEQRNCITLIDTTDGNGIEAQIILNEHEMAILEHDEEFLAFATPVIGISSYQRVT